MSIFGLDIGSTSTKAVQLEKSGDKFRFLAAGIVPTPVPGFASEAENDLVALATALKTLHQDAHITTKKVVVALPEGGIFTRVIELPPMSEDELVQAIPWEAEKFIPRPLTEVTLDWQRITRGGLGKEAGQTGVFLVAAPNILIEKYLRVCQMAGFEVAALETELVAAARALLPVDSPTSLLLDLGARTTDLAIVDKGQILMTRSIPTAGEALTRAISTGLSLEVAQAEEYKRTYGMEEKELEGKIRSVLTPLLEIIVGEIKKALAFWIEKSNKPVANLVLSGGTANLPEVATLLARTLGLEVQIADPFATLLANEQVVEHLKGNACLFSVAVGLAEKEI